MLRNSQAAQKGPDARRRPKAAREAYSLYVERAAEGANEADGPFSPPCLELDELGEDDVRHGADLVEGGGRHGVVEVQEGHRAAAATLPAELHAGDVDAVTPAEGADAADHARDVEVGE